MTDTIEQIILDVQSVCPDVDPNLARLWVRDAGRRTMEAAPWSWQIKRGQWVIPAPVTNITLGATATFTQNSEFVDFSAAVASTAWVGRQIRTAEGSSPYDIIGYVSATRVQISPVYGPATVAGSGFTIYQSKIIMPADMLELLSVVHPRSRWQLWIQVPQSILDGNDPSRSRGGANNPSLLSPLDYVTEYSGRVQSALRIIGTGPRPVTGGTYTGQSDAIFTVQVTTPGIGGTAVFKWRKNEEAYVTDVLSDAVDGNSLQDGVTVLFPTTSTFEADTFVFRATAQSAASLPRMELYPYPSSETVLQYLYVSRYPDLTDPGVVIPGMLANRGDILREKAMESCATWPGTEDRPNPYNQINRRDYHNANWTMMVSELVKQDRGLFQSAVSTGRSLPWAPWPFAAGRNLQEYDPWYMYPQDVY